MARSGNCSLKIWPDRHSGHVSIMNNILFTEKAFTKKYSEQNLFVAPLKNNSCFQPQLTKQTVWKEQI